MDGFDDNSLDLDGDGDDAIEMCLFFDEDGKNKQGGSKPPSSSGCCVVLVALGGAISSLGYYGLLFCRAHC
ncbi:MAG: hypothetical protein PF495_05670 [Spirochaetales bacterium]|jgi:hypothetical protein|nr:hypothetical protein [Spirochaetales bacterium]